ncbi:hypothetical protein ACKFKF_13710 [Phormidesmis sp. 146-12]
MNSKPIWQCKSLSQNSKPRPQKSRKKLSKFWQRFTMQQIDCSIEWHIRNWNLSGCWDDLIDDR